MTAVTFENAYLSLASDPTTAIVVPVVGLNGSVQEDVAVVEFASGRRRAQVGSQRRDEVQVQLGALAFRGTVWATLNDWIGEVVLWRDTSGRRLWGVYDTLPDQHLAGFPEYSQATLTIRAVTFSEGV